MEQQASNVVDVDLFPYLLFNGEGIITRVSSAVTREFNIDEDALIDKPLDDVLTLYQKQFSGMTIQECIQVVRQADAILTVENVNGTNVRAVLASDKTKAEENALLIYKAFNWQHKYEITNQNLIHLNRAIEGAHIGIWEYDWTTGEAYFSKQFKALIGLKSTFDINWEEFSEMVLEEDRALFKSFFSNHLNYNVVLNFEFRIEVKGEIRWFQIKGESRKQSDEGTIVMGSLIDCSQERDTLNALNNAIESKNLAMEAGKIGTWRAELLANDEWRWEWSYLANDMFGLDISDIGNLNKWVSRIHPDDKERVINSVKYSLETGNLYHENYRAILPSGEVKYILAEGMVGRDHSGKICRMDGICIDQTFIQEVQIEFKQLNADLEERVLQRTKEFELAKEQAERAKEQAEHASQIKSDFLSMMSHELRTPMNAIIGSLDLLATTKQTEESFDLINTAKVSANNLVYILNDILDINKIESGKLELEDTAFSIFDVIDNVIKVYLPVAEKKGIKLVVYEGTSLPAFVKGDPICVRQILFNLLGNAIKFTGNEGNGGEVTLRAEVLESNEYICEVAFTISDDGIGMTKEVQKKLFMPFTQAERSTTRKYGGTGLGLAICAKLTEMMGGRIGLKSTQDVGSDFRVEVPFWRSQETVALDVESLTGVRIAIVDLLNKEDGLPQRMAEHLTLEGAVVSHVDYKQLDKQYAQYDVLFVLVGDIKACEPIVANLYNRLPKTNNAYFVVDKDLIEYSRACIAGARLMPLQPLTRVQVVEAIKHVWQNNASLDLEELDLSELLIEPEEAQEEKVLKSGVLVVEDNSFNQKLIIKQMKNLGFECDIANDGVQGLKSWHDKNYKVIFTDCHMPTMDGYEMTRTIREQEQQKKQPPIPIIAITGAAMKGDEAYCLDTGMSDFLSKPVQLKDLKQALKKWYPND